MHEEMGPVNRAPAVCQTCALRKKACDKSLPSCGFCKRKNIFCHYESESRGPRRAYHPGRNFVAVPTSPSPGDSSNELNTIEALVDPTSQSMVYASPQSFDKYVYRHARHTIRTANLTPERIGQDHFRTFDRLLPIVSPELFRHVVLKFEDTATVPPADSSILLLSMLLARGLSDSTPAPPSHSLDRKSIYMAVKALVSQAQAAICTSLQLVQAAFLIAACEYLSGRPETAYASFMSCMGMSRILGVGDASMGTTRAIADGFDYQSLKVEMVNVDWAMATLERLILCETEGHYLRPLTELPGVTSRDTLDLQQLQEMQAISLLDEALCTTSSAIVEHLKIAPRIGELDHRIHTFLGAVLNGVWNVHDAPSTLVALAVRLLFLLHRAVTIEFQPSLAEGTSIHEGAMKSWNTLDSTCIMVIDIARHRRIDQAEVMPICCYYNLRVAKEHLQNRERPGGPKRDKEIGYLLDSEKQYCKKWCFS
ncbi:hypothetical protein EJ04DRAFT_554565 [Polyplosphaeria fusca]|uniref:Zn(2)-C6 fungal-type domain-containing protein n=1 Tax=Polyplosphaeria fusca TaxID=682080 RepID=A0A9P4QVE9_9PLEO|nr:hypothetical protein EJ04DRAFT_554565 [Polyplosphaeria fusca]